MDVDWNITQNEQEIHSNSHTVITFQWNRYASVTFSTKTSNICINIVKCLHTVLQNLCMFRTVQSSIILKTCSLCMLVASRVVSVLKFHY